MEFFGYDIQNPEVDIYVIDEFLKKYDTKYKSEKIDAYLSNEFNFKDEQMAEIFDELSLYRKELSNAKYKEYEDVDKIIKCIDNVFLAKELAAISSTDSVGYGTYRDKAMAENIVNIYDSL